MSLESGAQERETTHTHLHSKLPVEAGPSWEKEDGMTLNEVQKSYYTALGILITELRLF